MSLCFAQLHDKVSACRRKELGEWKIVGADSIHVVPKQAPDMAPLLLLPKVGSLALLGVLFF